MLSFADEICVYTGFRSPEEEEGSVPCPWKPGLAQSVKSSAFVMGLVPAEGAHQTRRLSGEDMDGIRSTVKLFVMTYSPTPSHVVHVTPQLHLKESASFTDEETIESQVKMLSTIGPCINNISCLPIAKKMANDDQQPLSII